MSKTIEILLPHEVGKRKPLDIPMILTVSGEGWYGMSRSEQIDKIQKERLSELAPEGASACVIGNSQRYTDRYDSLPSVVGFRYPIQFYSSKKSKA